MPMDPELTVRHEAAGPGRPVLVWRFDEPRRCVSSAVLGGGLGPRSWIVNASVPIDYSRTDPDRHLTEIAASVGLAGAGAGVGLLTAVDVTTHHLAVDGGVHTTATVGLSSPSWAAAPDGHFRREHPAGNPPVAPPAVPPVAPPVVPPVGTVNVVVAVPVPLSDAALVNAVVTATEAKAQAIWDAGLAATGTASDAICVHCPAGGSGEPYAGPRSVWGARLARAVHTAVLAGARHWLVPGNAVAWRP
jgi:adenosylcobinamide hydrolase